MLVGESGLDNADLADEILDTFDFDDDFEDDDYDEEDDQD